MCASTQAVESHLFRAVDLKSTRKSTGMLGNIFVASKGVKNRTASLKDSRFMKKLTLVNETTSVPILDVDALFTRRAS